ncbi:hypothetical protein [Halobacterium noricense]|uniref:hypothetical protein n=1 Tax=Halobacterium noricense TaxID=223182 RepID=UPI001E467D57|nr:hypothetical protein [Halobacterium noricense]UHH24412.1 hypothetical protein LT974_10470 [Halobacterium noricense]
MKREKEFRGISVRLARNYLESLGGTIVDDDAVEGDGWRAELSAEQVAIGPSLELTEVTVAFEADEGFGEEAFEALIEDFSRKAMRAGG